MVLPNDIEKISTMLYNEITGLRAGTIEDKRNWLVPVEENIAYPLVSPTTEIFN